MTLFKHIFLIITTKKVWFGLNLIWRLNISMSAHNGWYLFVRIRIVYVNSGLKTSQNQDFKKITTGIFMKFDKTHN